MDKDTSKNTDVSVLKVNSDGISFEFVELEALMARTIYHQVLHKIEDKFQDIDKATETLRSLSAEEYNELCAIFMANAQVGDEICDDFGTCTAFKKHPKAEVVALALSIAANFPGSFPLLLKGENTGESPSRK